MIVPTLGFSVVGMARWRSGKSLGLVTQRLRIRVITLSKLFTLIVYRPTQPSYPPG